MEKHDGLEVATTVPYNFTVFTVPMSCEYMGGKITSTGLFTGDSPLKRTIPLLLLQLGIVLLVSSLIHRLLRPFKQSRFVSDMLTGILLGPSFFHYMFDMSLYGSLFQGKQTTTVEILELLCFMYLSFMVGVKIDLSVIKTSGKRAWILGIVCFSLPVAIAFSAAALLGKMYEDMAHPLDAISILVATSSFHVTAVLLGDLNLLNSEIGRLALSSSLISNLLGLFFKSLTAFIQQNLTIVGGENDGRIWKTELCRVFTVFFIAIVPRRIMFLMMRKIPEGKAIREWHFVVILIILLVVGFWCEVFGFNAYFGSLILGFAMPVGPPMGSGVMEKLGMIISTLFIPSYIIDAGRQVNFSLIHMRTLGVTGVVILLAYIGKVVAAVIPSRLFKMPNSDALSLGLILSAQGFFDVILFKRALRFYLINEEMYSILTITAVFNAAIFTPLICYLYDPSKRYANYRRRTIQHARRDLELKLLICLHEEESSFSVMNLLKASNPTRDHPLCIFILDLIELCGREQPVLINHQFHKRNSSKLTKTDRIISSFQHFDVQNDGLFRNQYFTTITPYVSMHDDICTTALEKSASLIIIPYKRHESRAVRLVKKNMLDKAPCSVGFLIDKKIFTYFVSDAIKVKTFNVCVIFFGGPDSREALAYGTRMVESPIIRLSVISLIAGNELMMDLQEAKMDLNVITDLKEFASVNDRIEYKEVVVQDGSDTSRVLTSLEDVFDFILVGKRIGKGSALVNGLTEWDNHEDEELGIIGDILASSDMKSKASILVLQQQSIVEDLVKKWR